MEQERLRRALRAVEYRRVAASIHRPEWMLRAHRTPIARSAAQELVRSLSARYEVDVPGIGWGRRNWAAPDRNRLHFQLEGLTVHMVLHEFAHLLTGRRDRVPVVGNRRQWHGPAFVQALDRLLETTREFCFDSDLNLLAAVDELESTLAQRQEYRKTSQGRRKLVVEVRRGLSRVRRWLGAARKPGATAARFLLNTPDVREKTDDV